MTDPALLTTPTTPTTEPTPDPPFRYVVSGLRVASTIVLPSAIPEPGADATTDVVLRSGSVPEQLSVADRCGPDWQIFGTDFLLHVPGVARFLISDGRGIVFEALPGADPTDVALYLLGTCFAILLQQRGRVVLHASAVVVDDGAMLFCGPSGSGKSTLAATLCERGYPLLNDDVCSLSLAPDGRFLVHPDGRMLKLWAASVDHLGQTQRATTPVRAGFAKFYSAPSTAARAPRPVRSLYLLRASENGSEPSLQRLSLAEGTTAIQSNAFRPELVLAMNQTSNYFAASAALQRTASLYELARPMNFATAGRTLDLLEAHWRTGTDNGAALSALATIQGQGE